MCKTWGGHPFHIAVTAVALLCLTSPSLSGQSAWQIVTTNHFEIFYEPTSAAHVSAVVDEAERAYSRIAADLRHDLSDRVPLILVGNARELPANRTAAIDLVQRSGAPARDHLLLAAEPADGRQGRLTHELTHHFSFEIVFGYPTVPAWVFEGLSEYERVRWIDAGLPLTPPPAVVPSVSRLTGSDREWSRLVFEFVGDEFGMDGIRRYFSALKNTDPSNSAIHDTFGLTLDEFDREFDRYVKMR
jgi:hypothetical protein